MLQQIQPNIGSGSFQSSSHFSVTQYHSPFKIDSLSSVEAIRKPKVLQNLCRGLMWLPNRIFYLFKYCCSKIFFCFSSCRDPIDWKKTKLVFDRIQRVILRPSEYLGDKDRKARFREALCSLSEDALERFKWHIGVSIAKSANPSLSHSEQSQWYLKHREQIDFRQDYFDAISGNRVLVQAVKSFWAEIKNHA